jgi:hypothetical protein
MVVQSLQLISPVLYSLQVYWSNIFVLLKNIIRLLEQKLIDTCGLEMTLSKPELRWLGTMSVFLKRRGIRD